MTDQKGEKDVSQASIPAWKRGVRLRYDETREKWVIVSPERVSMLNETAAEILQLVDGERSIDAITQDLAARFEAPAEVIGKDVLAVLTDLRDRGLITC